MRKLASIPRISDIQPIVNAFGGEVYDYINSHNECPW
jgi:hypothetical protein